MPVVARGGRVRGELRLVFRRQIVYEHVAVALVAHCGAIGREFRRTGTARADRKGTIRQRVDVVVGGTLVAVQWLEMRLEDQVSRIVRPLERFVGERLRRPGESEAAGPEQQAVLQRPRIEDPDLLPARIVAGGETVAT